MASKEELVGILQEILHRPADRKELVKHFQDIVWNSPALEAEGKVSEVLVDLAYDLDYYVADPEAAREDPAFYGDQALEEEIGQALQRLNSVDV